MLDFIDGFRLEAGRWAFHMVLTVGVISLIAACVYASDVIDKRRRKRK